MRDNFTAEMGHSRCSIVEEVRIELIALAGAQDLQASIERYLWGWMDQPSSSHSLTLIWKFMNLINPRYTGLPQPKIERLNIPR